MRRYGRCETEVVSRSNVSASRHVRALLVVGAGMLGAFLVGSAVAASSGPVKYEPGPPAPISVVQLNPACVVAGGDVKLAVSRVERGSDVTLQALG